MTATWHASFFCACVELWCARIENPDVRITQIIFYPDSVDDELGIWMRCERSFLRLDYLCCHGSILGAPGWKSSIKNRCAIPKSQIVQRQKNSGGWSHPILSEVDHNSRL